MFLYFSIFTVLLLFALLDLANIKKQHKYPIYYSIFIFFILFTGLRWRTGADWIPYQLFYENYNPNLLFYQIGFEPGYIFLVKLSHFFSDKYTMMLMVMAVFNNLLRSYFFKNYTNYILLALLLFYCNHMFEFYGTRQALAGSIGLVNFRNIVKRRWALYFLFCAAAMTLHVSAVILFLAYPIYHFEWGTRSKVIWLVASIFIGMTGLFTSFLQQVGNLGFLGRLAEKAEDYSAIGAGVALGGANPLVILATGLAKRAVIFPVLFYFDFKLKGKDLYYNKLMNLLVFGNIIYFLVLEFYSIQRMAGYFYPIEIILMCIIVQRSKNKYIWFAIFALYGFIKLYFIVTQIAPYIIPYRSIFYDDFIPRPNTYNF